MPTLVFSQRWCELAVEAFMCLRTGRLQRDNPDTVEADELRAMADYVKALLVAEALPRPAPAPGRSLPEDPPVAPAARQLLYVKPDGTAFRSGAQMAASERRCSDQEHGPNKPVFLTSADWDASNRLQGRPLCQAHMAKTRRSS